MSKENLIVGRRDFWIIDHTSELGCFFILRGKMVTILTLVIKLMVLLLACTVIERVLLESAAVYVNDIPISIYILYKYIIASTVHAGFTLPR